MSKTAIIFNTSQNKNTYRYEIDQLKVVDWNTVLGCCLWNSKLKDQDMSFYVGMPAYEVYEDIKKYAEKELWSDVWKIGKPFSAKVVKASTIEEYAECAIKSYMHTLNFNNLCCVIANGKAKDIMQRISDLINDKDNFDSGYDIRRICMFGNNDRTIRYTDSREKLTFIPCNDSYAYYNMEDYYNELGFEVWDDYKLYEGKKENKIMKKNRMTEKKYNFEIGDIFINKYGLRIKITDKEKFSGDTYETIEIELLDDDDYGMGKKGDKGHIPDYDLDVMMKNDKYVKLEERRNKIMNKKLTEKEESVIDKIQDLIDNTDDLSSISFDMNESDINSADDVFEYIEDRINEIEVIYYSNAMKILSEHDPSLQESMEYADNYGYRCKDINSELLATILCQEWARQDLDDIRDDIEEVVDEWLESDEDDE